MPSDGGEIQSHEPPVSPNGTGEPLFELGWAFAQTRVFIAAVELDLFTHIANGKSIAKEIASAANADERGVRILLNACVPLGLLEKSGEEYLLTPISDRYLVKGKAEYYGNSVPRIDRLWDAWGHLTESARSGKPFKSVDEVETGSQFFEGLVLLLYDRHLPGAKQFVEHFNIGSEWKWIRVLDVAAGSGVWGITIARADPEARVTAHDWETMLAVTRRKAEQEGVGEQFDYLPGDLTVVDFGEGKYDLAILGHICHSEGERKTRDLIARMHRALRPGGKLLIADFIPNDDHTGPLFPLLFAANMLVLTNDGDTFTFAEYSQWCREAGFVSIETIEAPAPSPLIVAHR